MLCCSVVISLVISLFIVSEGSDISKIIAYAQGHSWLGRVQGPGHRVTDPLLVEELQLTHLNTKSLNLENLVLCSNIVLLKQSSSSYIF